MHANTTSNPFPDGARVFATTRWSIVLAADAAPQAREALGQLCRIYWYPLYAYARRQGFSAQDGQDLTQDFFARLMEKDGLAGVEGVTRFRAFLLAAFKHFLSNARDRERAQKRGGALGVLSLDAREGEARYSVEAVTVTTPERLFERRWALALLERTLARVEGEYQNVGKHALFEALKPGLTGSEDSRYAEIAANLKVTVGAVKVAAHRLRQRYRDVLRAEIAETVGHPDEVEDELRFLMQALSTQ